jgi:hypothetical protein
MHRTAPEIVSNRQLLTLRKGVKARILTASSATPDSERKTRTFRVVLDRATATSRRVTSSVPAGSSPAAAAAPEDRATAIPGAGAVPIVIHGGTAPAVSVVRAVFGPWNWAHRELADRRLADQVSAVTFHMHYAPTGSTIWCYDGDRRIGEMPLPITDVLNDSQWARAAWQLAIMLVSSTTDRCGRNWIAPPAIAAKALVRAGIR